MRILISSVGGIAFVGEEFFALGVVFGHLSLEVVDAVEESAFLPLDAEMQLAVFLAQCFGGLDVGFEGVDAPLEPFALG